MPVPESKSPYPPEVRERVVAMRQEGHSWSVISEATGVPRGTVRMWVRQHEERTGRPIPPAQEQRPRPRPAPAPPAGEEGRERQVRAEERPPQAPGDAPRLPPPPAPLGDPSQIDLSQVRGYVKMAYDMAGKAAGALGDPVAENVIAEHSDAAATAWEHYIASNPAAQEFFQRMLVGTPLGEVIFVHVSLVFSYTLARATARELARVAAEPPADE